MRNRSKQDKFQRLSEDSKTITIRNLSKYSTPITVKLEGFDPDGFNFFDFDTMEILMTMIVAGKRGWVGLGDKIKKEDRLLLGISFSVYDLLKAMGMSLGSANYEKVRLSLLKLKTYKRISVISNKIHKAYDVPLIFGITPSIEDPLKEKTVYKVVFSPVATKLLLFDRRVKSTIPRDVLDAYFSLPVSLRKVVLYLLNFTKYTMPLKNAIEIAGLKKNPSRLPVLIVKYKDYLDFLGVKYDTQSQTIEFTQKKTIVDFMQDREEELHNRIEEVACMLMSLDIDFDSPSFGTEFTFL